MNATTLQVIIWGALMAIGIVVGLALLFGTTKEATDV